MAAPPPPHEPVAQRLAEQTVVMLDLWEQRVRQRVPASEDQDAPLLRDHLPTFLFELAQRLDPEGVPDASAPPVSELHGRERAESGDYSLEEVILEYGVLREVVIEVLESTGPVTRQEHAQIRCHFDEAMARSAAAFTRIHYQIRHEQDEQYRLLVEGAQDYALLLLDQEGCFTAWSPGAERLTGYAAAEALGQRVSLLFTPEDVEAGIPERELEHAVRTGAANDTRWHLRKDGSLFWAVGVTRPLSHADGHPRGFAKVMSDQTERHRLEAELRRQAELLARADARKNEFLAMLAHEMRTPISAISNALYILEHIELPDGRSVRHLGTATRQAQQLARLAEDLLDVARITQGTVELRRERHDLRVLARSAAEAAAPFVDSRGQQFACEIGEVPLWSEVDADRIEQVITNLLNNAARYTEPGGSVGLDVDREGDWGVIRVRDTGVGIEPVMLPQIFDLFTQVAPRAEQSRGGLGIGLTIVQRLVELHGGTVTASSEGVGAGTEFTVRLPLLPTS